MEENSKSLALEIPENTQARACARKAGPLEGLDADQLARLDWMRATSAKVFKKHDRRDWYLRLVVLEPWSGDWTPELFELYLKRDYELASLGRPLWKIFVDNDNQGLKRAQLWLEEKKKSLVRENERENKPLAPPGPAATRPNQAKTPQEPQKTEEKPARPDEIPDWRAVLASPRGARRPER